MKSYKDETDEGYFLEVDTQYLEKITWTSKWLNIFTGKDEYWTMWENIEI